MQYLIMQFAPRLIFTHYVHISYRYKDLKVLKSAVWVLLALSNWFSAEINNGKNFKIFWEKILEKEWKWNFLQKLDVAPAYYWKHDGNQSTLPQKTSTQVSDEKIFFFFNSKPVKDYNFSWRYSIIAAVLYYIVL